MHSAGRESWLRTTFHRIFCHWSSKAGPEPTRCLRPGPAWTHAGFHTCKDPKIRKHTNVSCLSHIILAFSIHANKWCSQHLRWYFQRAGTSCLQPWLTETFTLKAEAKLCYQKRHRVTDSDAKKMTMTSCGHMTVTLYRESWSPGKVVLLHERLICTGTVSRTRTCFCSPCK